MDWLGFALWRRPTAFGRRRRRSPAKDQGDTGYSQENRRKQRSHEGAVVWIAVPEPLSVRVVDTPVLGADGLAVADGHSTGQRRASNP